MNEQDIDDNCMRFAGGGTMSWTWGPATCDPCPGTQPAWAAAGQVTQPEGESRRQELAQPSMRIVSRATLTHGRAAFVLDVVAEGKIQVRLFDAAGRAVRDLADKHYSAGLHHLDWDGKDDNGRQ